MVNPVTGKPYPTRGRVFRAGLRSTAVLCLQMLVVMAFLFALLWLLSQFWVILLPVILAIVVATVLWPLVRLLLRFRTPPALASLVVLFGGVGVIAGVIALIVPSVVDQAPELADRAVDGVRTVQKWVQGPPLNVDDEQLSSLVNEITSKLQSSATAIASGVFSGVGVATSALITLFTTVVLVFFFLKDGPRFLPWLERTMGKGGSDHLSEILRRMWDTLGGFIRTQAIVSFVDASLIGIGLIILDVPLAAVLIVITFLGGFIPIVGAFVAGALAVLIALVSNGLTSALIVLGIILAVQQLEGNVLSPWLQSKSMNLHAVIVLLSVTLGGTLFGITGAFLAVPTASCLAVALRYILEQIGQAAGEEVAAEDEAARAAAKEKKRRRRGSDRSSAQSQID
ncbi:AI-2E family transporter [Gordonia sp. (in: high G+C Gram-positive bacteria)]|uniref:AI-2E family transporter n=1 Tax=Gordonia sp. (in: high G+C Gram-positive bacteria) TaxID=84139 RepID=UPI0025C4AB25|nr:AI-2E family transporter [Gordonia sp. (in: high G+C Gram-positive bacteria)]